MIKPKDIVISAFFIACYFQACFPPRSVLVKEWDFLLFVTIFTSSAKFC